MIEKTTVALKNLYLDPENFRIIDKIKEADIKPETGLTEVSQNKIMNILLGGNKASDIKDLIQSFQTNGFLNVNQIHAKKNSDGKYIVMEGNRRVATLKYIHQLFKKKEFELNNLSEDIFENVPITIYSTEETKNHLIIAGLDHISGKKKWPSKNQAEFLYKSINEHGYSQEELSLTLGGFSKTEIRRSLKTYALMQMYKKNDIGIDDREITYTVFRTVVTRPEIRNWLKLEFVEDGDCSIINKNDTNLEKLFSWISPTACKEKGYKETIIRNEGDVNLLAKIINDKNALEILETNGDLNWAVGSSGIQARENAKANLRKAFTFIKSVDEFSTFLEKDDLFIANEIEKFAKRINHATSSSINTEEKNRVILNVFPASSFTEIYFEDYKVLKNVKLENPKRINIIAGKNNKGKSTILEGIFLLCNLNDPFQYIDLLKKRGRYFNFPESSWINYYAKNLKINGVYNQQDISL